MSSRHTQILPSGHDFALESQPHPALLVSRGRVLAANSAFAALVGPDVTPIRNRLAGLVHADDREKLKAALRKRSAQPVSIHARLIGRAGLSVWTEITLSVPPSFATANASFMLTFVDIDRLKRADLALLESERRWHFALETARQGVWDHDNLTGSKFYSEVWHEIRGYKVGDKIPDTLDTWIEVIHPADRERVLDYVDKQDRGLIKEISYEYRERHADGHWIWILCRGRAVAWDRNNIPTRLIGTDTDITGLKAAEEQLSGLSRRLELALDVATVGVWETDLETGEVFWDPRMREIYGLEDKSDLAPLQWENSLHPDDAAKAIATTYGSLAERKPYTSQFRILRPNGDIRHVRASGCFYLDSDDVLRAMGVNWDVTEDVDQTEELQKARNLEYVRNLELEAARALMEHNSLHDALTELPNRRFLDNVLEDISARSAGRSVEIALLHLDLDRFKEINDTLGHAAGDAMLIHSANTLRARLDPDDILARIGGDEFVVIIQRPLARRGLIALADTIIADMSRPVPYGKQECRIGISIGIASEKGRTIDAKRLLMQADVALYQAKRSGRGRAMFFTEALQVEISQGRKLGDDILSGLEKGEFLVHYQPKYEAGTLRLTGAEALARWQHPTEGLLPPARFLAIAHELGVVEEIDRIVLDQALARHKQWRNEGIDIPNISVNVSARRLRSENLVSQLRHLDFKPGSLSFELLESTFLDDDDEIIAWNLDQIRELGIGIDIDDFGSGHASIVGLLKLRPDQFKIDRRIIAPLPHSKGQRQLVGSIINIGKSLNIAVVAEGVETKEHADLLADLGCQVLQGYWLGRPMTADELTTHVTAAKTARHAG